ncbi:hypothetical protein [Streptomyces sp. NPDC001380]|uniref:hypothetical protein n=1 Tax=Streptomyces sp. NPDC001380 TaxID=3364566 RepID=UPI003686EFB2
MHVHRSQHTRGFTVLPNTLLQDRRLSYTARGLLADLLSRPDGWSEDGRRMADTSPQGRHAVAKALRELASFGYYRVDRVRRSDGTFVSEVHVYDTPQPAPDPMHPGSGRRAPEAPASHPVKNRGKAPSLPAQRTGAHDRGPGTGAEGRDETPSSTAAPEPPIPVDAGVREAVALLHRVIRPEPRLRIGAADALALAPLVSAWLERGYRQRDLSEALLAGLPQRVHSAQALLRDRLTRKLPAVPEPAPAPQLHSAECAACSRPIPHEGICRVCAGLDSRPDDTAERARIAARGRAEVRAALLGRSPGHLLPSRA